MAKIGVIGIQAGWSSELLADTVERLTGHRRLIDLAAVRFDLETGDAWFQGENLAEYDGFLIKKIGSRYSPDLLDRLECLRLLHENGTPMFSSPGKILRVLDRLSCTVTLRSGRIPMPPTTITESVDAALEAVDIYGEAVFKPLYTSKARGMQVVSKEKSPEAAIREYHRENHFLYIQKKIDLAGKDLGVVFLGGEYLTTYARCASSDAWNTTTRSGGKYAAYDPPAEVIDIAEKAQALFGLDFTCVDVAETADGPMVFEVSAFGGFKGIMTTRDLPIAAMLTEYALERI